MKEVIMPRDEMLEFVEKFKDKIRGKGYEFFCPAFSLFGYKKSTGEVVIEVERVDAQKPFGDWYVRTNEEVIV